jgi:RimJ/RimL family protein N-acetyltransferase
MPGTAAAISNKEPMQSNQLNLRRTEKTDLETLFQFQRDEQANYVAAFTPQDWANQEAYVAIFTTFLSEPTINMRTIVVGETIVGSIAKFEIEGDAELTYWIDRSCWGKGIATAALKEFLAVETARPIYGRVAFDNIGSQKVLERCGFVKIGTDKEFANARQAEVEEYIYRLGD